MRPQLVRHGEFEFTSDTVVILDRLAERVGALKAKLVVGGRSRELTSWASVTSDPGPTGLPPEHSAALTGREVLLRIRLSETVDVPVSQRERELAMLWAIAVPLGLVPFTRYPLPGPHDQVFHYFGDWAAMLDGLLGAGRGEEGWPAFCCAAMLDVGRWEGSRSTERLVQAHLHRIGFNVGAVDGIVGVKTQSALKSANLHSMTLVEAAKRIANMAPTPPERLERPLKGQLDLQGVDFSIHPFGQVRATKTVKGADLLIAGPGRYVLDVRGPR